MSNRQTSPRDPIDDRALMLGAYIAEHAATVRSTAAVFGISKSTVHKDITSRLPRLHAGLSAQVHAIIEKNKQERHIRPLSEQRLLPEDTQQIISEIYQTAGRDMAHYNQAGDDDFSFAVPGLARFRVNAYRQRGSAAAVIRLVSFDIPDWRAIGIPEQVMALAELTSGMILVTGTAGSGMADDNAIDSDNANKTKNT